MIDFIDDSDKLALGADFVKKIDKNLKDVEKEVSDIEKKLPPLLSLKKMSEEKGEPLSTEAAKKLLETIDQSLLVEIQNIKKAVYGTFLPIKSEMERVLKLLSSSNEIEQDSALQRIEDLRKVFKDDFEIVAGEMNKKLKELISLREFKKESDRKQEQLAKDEKIKLIEERDILREKGINTYYDEQTKKLQVLSIRDEKKELKILREDEKKLQQMKYDYKILEKEERLKEVVDNDKLNKARKDYQEQEKKILNQKDKLNIKPQESTRGPIAETYGAMIGQIKAFGSELKNVFKPLSEFGKSLSSFVSGNGIFKTIGKAFTSLGKSIGSLVGAITRAATSAVAAAFSFLIANAKTIAIAAAIGLIIYGLVKLFSFLTGKSNSQDQAQKQASMENYKETDNPNDAFDPNYQAVGPTGAEAQARADKFLPTASSSNKAANIGSNSVPKILPMSTGEVGEAEAGAREYTDYPQTFRRTNINAPINLNKMSTDFAIGEESKPSTIITNAPSSQNVINNNNTTQSVSMVPINQDRSFINLNTVPV
jgi:hypothetical protein